MSIKHKGADSILYNAEKGALMSSLETLAVNTWYKISSRAASGSTLPDMDDDSVFKTPLYHVDQITMAVGDAVWRLTLTEICKADVEVSGEMGVIETTDSCDYPYNTSIPDGFTNLSGSINTMMRFDEDTDELVDVTKDFLVKFYDIIEDDGEGTYVVTSKDDSDLLLMILMNKDNLNVGGKIENWLITPAILSGVSTNFALKDVDKADYTWTKGQGPASIYLREVPSTS